MKYPTWLRRIGGYLLAFAVGTAFGIANLPHGVAAADDLTPTSMVTAQASVPISTESFVSAAVSRSGPAVVRIDTETVVTRRTDPILDDPFFQEFFGRSFPVPPRERRIAGQGSGFIIDNSGIILTNAHVVNSASKVVVTLRDGRTFDGQVRGTDEVTDLAVVKIEPQGSALPVAPLGTSGNLQVGDWAIAVGNPVGLDNTVTLGIISTLGRSAAQAGIPDKRVEFIQTDAAINPGNSGGPLLNARGEVIGINTAIRADATGIGFAIPIDQAKAIQNTLAAGGTVPHPYIGVQMMNITVDQAQQNNRNPNSPFIIPEVNGILVMQVLPGTPAERAGIRRGDVIVAVDGTPISDGARLQRIVEQAGLNKALKLELLRGDRRLSLTVQTAQLRNPTS
ncbi:trypsin-like peptidase domain-containing protein [Synechocystis salina LEGE 06099]|uniref:HhoA/HhoB/HtrA family serine endopeptidase n=1 Tax=Synechocystis salina TaxID=945780 RepID=UPI001882D376|nr:HhoA/HhoB/HtrA family serine endopeptidase [Synechocystis salina]MBE9203797.1 trypsin-like peptidase domain-containing protein [Synechocystis salina LEGE 06099]